MVRFTYKLTTLSSLIVSPRANLAWYGDLNEFSLADIKEDPYLSEDKLKIIYPFYQYGEYEKHAPNSAKYYLPGSSIKGALCGRSPAPFRCMVDDIPVCNDSIVVRNLYKAQYLKEEQQADFDVFFENVGVEMIRASVKLTGELYLDNTKKNEFVDAARSSTKEKMKQMLEYLCILKDKNYKEKLRGKLNEADANLSALLNGENIYLMGGYKGLLHSMAPKIVSEETASAIFLDPETKLPHGLVKMEFVKE
jgi:hypothetical protein